MPIPVKVFPYDSGQFLSTFILYIRYLKGTALKAEFSQQINTLNSLKNIECIKLFLETILKIPCKLWLLCQNKNHVLK